VRREGDGHRRRPALNWPWEHSWGRSREGAVRPEVTAVCAPSAVRLLRRGQQAQTGFRRLGGADDRDLGALRLCRVFACVQSLQ